MKILLTLPRFKPNSNPPLGIAYIAACLRKQGFDAEILDSTFESWDFAAERLKKADFDILGLSCYTMNYELAKKMALVAKNANKKVLTVVFIEAGCAGTCTIRRYLFYIVMADRVIERCGGLSKVCLGFRR